MTSIYSLTTWVAWGFGTLVFVLCVSMAMVAGATAQEQPGNETATPTPETQIDEEIQDQLGDLVIHSYEYDGNTETMTIEATWTGRAPETVTLTEMIELDSAGSTKISFQKNRLRPDERTEIKIGAKSRTGGTAAIMVTTQESVENNDALILQAGDPNTYPAIRFQNAALATVLAAVGAAAVTFVFVLRKKHTDEHGKERIA